MGMTRTGGSDPQTKLHGAFRWLFGPATEATPRAGVSTLAAVRVLAGLLWIYNVGWKQPPDFGRDNGNLVYGYLQDAIDHPVLPPYSWAVEHIVVPNFLIFAYGVLLVEMLLAILLLTGTAVRFAALLGIFESLAIGLSVASTPGEWPWSYMLMVGLHVALLVTAAGAAWSVDNVRAEAAAGRGAAPASRLLGSWGGVLAGTGLIAIVLSLGEDPLAASGATVGLPSLELSVGSYNLVGAVVLLAIAAFMLAAWRTRQKMYARVAAVVAAATAVSIVVQQGRTDVWLGASNSSAAFFICATVVSAVTAGLLTRDSEKATEQSRG